MFGQNTLHMLSVNDFDLIIYKKLHQTINKLVRTLANSLTKGYLLHFQAKTWMMWDVYCKFRICHPFPKRSHQGRYCKNNCKRHKK